MPPRTQDQDLCHLTTSSGVDIYLKRTPGGQLRVSLRTGPTDPRTHTFPIEILDYDELRLILLAEQTSALTTIAEAVSQHSDDAIPALLANIGAELNPGDVDSLASKLLRALGGVAAATEPPTTEPSG